MRTLVTYAWKIKFTEILSSSSPLQPLPPEEDEIPWSRFAMWMQKRARCVALAEHQKDDGTNLSRKKSAGGIKWPLRNYDLAGLLLDMSLQKHHSRLTPIPEELLLTASGFHFSTLHPSSSRLKENVGHPTSTPKASRLCHHPGLRLEGAPCPIHQYHLLAPATTQMGPSIYPGLSWWNMKSPLLAWRWA